MTVQIYNINPIALDAVVTSGLSGITIVVNYDVPPATAADTVGDDFTSIPSTLTVNVTSTTVPSGHHIGATGDGTWTSNSSSSITGSFSPDTVNGSTFDFTIVVSDESGVVARHDPRLNIRKMSTVDPHLAQQE